MQTPRIIVTVLSVACGLVAQPAFADCRATDETGRIAARIHRLDPCGEIHPARLTTTGTTRGKALLPSQGERSDMFPHGYGVNLLQDGGEGIRVGDNLYTTGPSNHFGYTALVVEDGPGGSANVDINLGSVPFALIEHQMHVGPAVSIDEYLSWGASNDSLGAYAGDGRTLHLPTDYHDGTWGVRGYPARVYKVALAGEDQSEVAQNLRNVAGGLQAHMYERHTIQYPTLAEQLRAYRRWLLVGEKTDLSGREYTALILNIGLNVPHNVDAYNALWPGEGNALFEAAEAKGFKPTHFEPLYKKMGFETGDRGLIVGTGQAEPFALAPINAEEYVDAVLRKVFTPGERLAAANERRIAAGLTPSTSLCEAEFRDVWKYIVREKANGLRSKANPFRVEGAVAYPLWILSMLESGILDGNPHVMITTVGTAVDSSDLIEK